MSSARSDSFKILILGACTSAPPLMALIPVTDGTFLSKDMRDNPALPALNRRADKVSGVRRTHCDAGILKPRTAVHNIVQATKRCIPFFFTSEDLTLLFHTLYSSSLFLS